MSKKRQNQFFLDFSFNWKPYRWSVFFPMCSEKKIEIQKILLKEI